MIGPSELHFLSKLPLFSAVSETAMRRLGDLARRVDFDAPTVLFREGETAREMVVVLAGELEVRKRGRDGIDARLATLRTGDVAGEISLIDIQPRSAGVQALGPASLIVVQHADLTVIHKEDPAAYTILIMNIAREISRRLRRVDGLLANLLIDVQEVWSTGVEAGRDE
jgi:CRP/FNR family transcriptional regulator, cyclic AMP receptor protein